MTLPSLLLQKPSKNSKAKEHTSKLEERMKLWNDAKINKLLKEGQNIQKKLLSSKSRSSEDNARIFSGLMFKGKINAALKFLSEESDHGMLLTNDEVLDELKRKHPEPASIPDNVLLEGPIDQFPESYFDSLDETVIKNAARLTKGAAGLSHMDSEQYKHILVGSKFKKEGKDLREQIALLARKIATKVVDPLCLESYMACRLIPLNKNPGVRPIGIGEILRHIIGKSIGWILKMDIQSAAGPLQASTGIKGGAEAAIHTMKDLFESEETDAVILVDASNAFNSLNRVVALHNIQYTCPEFSVILINTYREPSRLIVLGKWEISS